MINPSPMINSLISGICANTDVASGISQLVCGFAQLVLHNTTDPDYLRALANEMQSRTKEIHDAIHDNLTSTVTKIPAQHVHRVTESTQPNNTDDPSDPDGADDAAEYGDDLAGDDADASAGAATKSRQRKQHKGKAE
jgi:hypothetical protein